MPKLGLTMQEGTIVELRKEEGDEVKKGEVLFVIETEKVRYEVEAPESGILAKWLAKVGDVLPVGAVVAYILRPGESPSSIPEAARAEEPVRAEPKIETAVEVAGSVANKANVPQGVKISLLARKLAEEHKVDVAGIKGTGPGGRIVKEDVLRAIEEKKIAAVVTKKEAKPPIEEAVREDSIVPLTSLRRTIARRMVESFQSAPHFYSVIEVDTSELEAFRQRIIPSIEKRTGVRVTLTDLIIKIVAVTLLEFPNINATYTPDGIKLLSRIDIGLATSVEDGLIVPVIRQADRLTISEIAKIRNELVIKARERRISPDEITGSTFTITNMGMFGITGGAAIINPPEAAILLVNSIVERPVVKDGQIVVRPMMNLTLSIDHRVLDGVAAARFLQRVKELIENPALLII
jgi:pyruvate dehydrogenase E2 component (dihydrolipoamide acetyltransferase)